MKSLPQRFRYVDGIARDEIGVKESEAVLILAYAPDPSLRVNGYIPNIDREFHFSGRPSVLRAVPTLLEKEYEAVRGPWTTMAQFTWGTSFD